MPLIVNKKIGETPLEVVNKYRKGKEKTSFAGRLDPMARGKMIILQGIECKSQDKYCNLNKTYRQILFGFSSDTYDIMGLSDNDMINYNVNKINELNLQLNKYIGTINSITQYSSIIVKNNLWWWAEKKIDKISIPFKNIEIYKLKMLRIVKIDNLLEEILKKLNTLNPNRKNDFRIPKIIERWNYNLKNYNQPTFIYEYEAKVSSGTYLRSLVNKMGKDLNIKTLAFDINRINFE